MPAGWCCTKAGCMSTTDATGRGRDGLREPRRVGVAPRRCRASRRRSCRSRPISGRALVAVVAIMTFLASLTTGAVMLVRAAANEWQAEVAREVTIQVRPAAGRDIEADIAKAPPLPARRPGVDRGAALFQGGSGAPARAVARHRASARRSAGAAHHRGADRAGAAARSSRNCARRSASRCPAAEPRRPSRLRRSHARHGAAPRSSAASACWCWCWPPPCCRSRSRPAPPWQPTAR